jgi:hypothetical protein
MPVGISRITKRRIKAASALSAAAVVVALAPGLGSPASAASLSLHLPSATLVVATPSTDGTKVTFVASMKVLGLPGLLLTPSGSVTFTNADTTLIGTAPVQTCLLTTCTATLANVPLAALHASPEGIATVTGAWGGDLIGAPSAGTVDIAISNCDVDGCSVDVSNTTTDLSIFSNSDQGTIIASLGGPALPCSITGGGSIGNYATSGLNDGVEVELVLTGAAATAYDTVQNRTTHDYMCWVKANPFTAYTNNGSATFNRTATDFNRLGAAALITSGPYAGQYVGLLADCEELNEGDSSPCIEFQGLGEGTGSPFFTDISASADDPHAGGG